MNVCNGCKIPTIVSRDQTWNDDGTITLTGIPDYRMVLLEVPMLNELVSRLEAVSGPKVKTLMTEGSRMGSYNYASGLLKGPLKFVVRHTATGARIAYSKLMDSAWALGLGKIFLDSYSHRDRIAGKVYNGFNLPLLTGIVQGTFNAIEGFESKSQWTDRGQFSEVSIWMEKDARPIEKPPPSFNPPRVTAGHDLDRCKTCGMPKDVVRFKWRSEKGVIEDERTGTRMVLIGLSDLAFVYTALQKAQGVRISEVIRAVNTEHGHEMVTDGWVKDLEDLGRDLAAKGLGHLNLLRDGKKTAMTVLNYNHREFAIGRCIGAFEELHGKDFTMELKDNGPGSVTITLTKK